MGYRLINNPRVILPKYGLVGLVAIVLYFAVSYCILATLTSSLSKTSKVIRFVLSPILGIVLYWFVLHPHTIFMNGFQKSVRVYNERHNLTHALEEILSLSPAGSRKIYGNSYFCEEIPSKWRENIPSMSPDYIICNTLDKHATTISFEWGGGLAGHFGILLVQEVDDSPDPFKHRHMKSVIGNLYVYHDK